MNFFRVAFVALLFPFILTACQSSQTASSSYAGSSLGKKAVKSAASVRRSGSFSSSMRFEESSYALAERSTASAEQAAAKRVAKKSPATKVTRKAKVKKVRSRKLTRKSIAKSTVAKKLKRSAAAKRSKKAKSRRVAKLSKRSHRGKRSRYNALIRKYARANGVPIRLAHAVVQVESNYRSNARGRAGEIGLMQIMPRTARGIGYRGKMRNLYNPATNLRYGMKYLGKAYRLGGRSTCGAILKYNAGHGAKRMNPISRKYCQRVRRILRRT